MAQATCQYKFHIGEKVFAKVKGYPPWPAVIDNTELSSKLPKYRVIFYDTKETAIVKEIDVCGYRENKSRLGNVKTKSFCRAMNEAEVSFNEGPHKSKFNISLTNNDCLTKQNGTFSTIVTAQSINTSIELCDDKSPFSSKCASNQEVSVGGMNDFDIFTKAGLPNCSTPDVSDSKSVCMINYGNISQMDKAVNTTPDLDLSFQLNALTDRCIDLEKSLIDKEEKSKEQQNQENFLKIHREVQTNLDLVAVRDVGGFTTSGTTRCETCRIKIDQLNNKIKHLERINVQLMETIRPFPPSNKEIEKELEIERKTIEKLQKKFVLEIQTKNEIIQVLVSDLEKLKTDYEELEVESSELLNRGVSNTNYNNNKAKWSQVTSSKHSRTKQRQNKTVTAMTYGAGVPISNPFQVLGNAQSLEEDDLYPYLNQSVAARKSKLHKNNLDELKKKFLQQRSNKKVDHRITVLSDSHGRSLPIMLNNSCPSNVCVSGLVKPSAFFDQVCLISDKQSHTKDDYIVILGGSNDIGTKSDKDIIKSMKCTVSCLAHTNVLLGTLPYRHDCSPEDKIHKEILSINYQIRNLANENAHVKILDLYNLKRHFHSPQGQHLNKRGKREVLTMILAQVHVSRAQSEPKSDFPLSSLPEQNSPTSTSPVRSQLTSHRRNSIGPTAHIQVLDKNITMNSSVELQNNTVKSNRNPIEVVEANMEDMFSRLSKEAVGFAHCISGDFEDSGQMSAGVAIVFREHFGRPKKTDCLNKYLAYQRVKEGGIYSLITKPKFYQNPRISVYDKAFEELVRDFKKNGFTQLVCSPMGCTRDHITIEHFVKKICEFQKICKVPVDIVVFDEKSQRGLRSGLSHQEFVKHLNHVLSLNQELQRPDNTKDSFTSASMEVFPPLLPSSSFSSVVALNNSLSNIFSHNSVKECSATLSTPPNSANGNDITSVNANIVHPVFLEPRIVSPKIV